MKRDRKRGFTLVELVIVIAVIAVLAAILIPTFMTVVEKSRYSADIQAARNMSTLTKTAAINGATDADGNDIPNISMNETSGVVATLKANGYNLVPKSKNAAFWYNRATGDVQVIKNEDIFTSSASAGKIGATSMPILNASSSVPVKNAEIGSPETEFKQDCLEALIADKPSYVYIDQSDKNPVTKAINAINNLIPVPAQGAAPFTFEKITADMTTAFSANVLDNKDVKKVLGVKDASTPSSAWTHLLEFSPADSLYISDTGAYTTKAFTDTKSLNHALFTQGATAFGSWYEVAPETLKGKSLTFANPISIPVAINNFRLNAMTTIDPKTTIIINKKYSENELYGSGCKATVVDNTGKIQITHKILKYDDFTYDQYGVRYFDYKVIDTADDKKDTTNYVSGYDTLQSFLKGTQLNAITPQYDVTNNGATIKTNYGVRGAINSTYKKVKSIYAVPNIAISPILNDNSQVTLKPITGNEITMDFKYYSRNAGNLTVMYGSIIAENNVYKIQDVAYIKSVSTYTISKSGVDTFVVSDPLAGGYYYNLGGISVSAVDADGVETKMTLQQYGSSKGDFELQGSNGISLSSIAKIYVRDIKGNIILIQEL